MRIAFVNSIKTWGGGEKWHYENSVYMSQLGHQVFFIGSPQSDLHQKLQSHPTITYYAVTLKNKSFLNPIKLYGIQKWLDKNRIEVVVINHPSDLKIVSLAAKRAGIQRIIYRRGLAKPIKNSFLNRLLFKNYVTDVLANSQATKKTINAEGFLFDDNKIEVIYNPIDIPEFVQRPYEPVGIKKQSDELILGSIGRLSPEKNHRFLIDLSVALKAKQIKHRIYIAGVGKLEQELKEYSQEKETKDTVHFIGFLQNVKDLLKVIDVFILPSLWEGFGYALAEAALCQKPVIAFDTGSIPELVVNNSTGFITPINAVEEVVDKLIILQDATVREQMGQAGFEFASQKFNRLTLFKQLEKYLTQPPL